MASVSRDIQADGGIIDLFSSIPLYYLTLKVYSTNISRWGFYNVTYIALYSIHKMSPVTCGGIQAGGKGNDLFSNILYYILYQIQRIDQMGASVYNIVETFCRQLKMSPVSCDAGAIITYLFSTVPYYYLALSWVGMQAGGRSNDLFSMLSCHFVSHTTTHSTSKLSYPERRLNC